MKAANFDIEPHVGAEAHAEIWSAYGHPVWLVLDGKSSLFEQAHGDRKLEGQVAPALVVTRPARLLADLVAIGLGEGAKPWRRDQPHAYLSGERRTIGA